MLEQYKVNYLFKMSDSFDTLEKAKKRVEELKRMADVGDDIEIIKVYSKEVKVN